MPDWTKSLKFCAYKAQESGRLQRLSEKVREDQRRPEKIRNLSHGAARQYWSIDDQF
jgi:hypothetical protein